VREGPEECDGADFDLQTCATFGLTSGSLSCTPACTISRTGCIGPDLIVYAGGLNIDSCLDSPTTVSACEVSLGCALPSSMLGGMPRKLWHFTLVSENIGNATLYFGSPSTAPLWTPSCFGWEEFAQYADYWLCPASEPSCASAGSVRVATGNKGSFCFIENFGAAPDWTGAPASCGMYTCGNMGQQPGCADDYYVGLDCQFLDVSLVAPGSYTICAWIDPTNQIPELRDDNNIACTAITIPASESPPGSCP
jgi:hypothetical protein